MASAAQNVSAVNFLAADSPDTVVARRTRVASLSITTAGAAGSVELKNGVGGTTLLKVVTSADSSMHDVVIPGDGILFDSQAYCILTKGTSITLFYS